MRALLASRRAAWTVTFGLAAAIGILSIVSDPGERIGVRLGDKLAHFLAYGALAVALAHALALGRARLGAGLAAVALAAAYGAALEGVQALTPERFPSGLDALVNLIGAAAGVLLYFAAREVARVAAAALVIASAALGVSGCGTREAREASGPPSAFEARLLEFGALRTRHSADDLRRLYAALEAREPTAEGRVVPAYFRARLEPDRAARRAALEALAPAFSEAYLALGDLAFEEGDRRRAMACWDRAPPGPRTAARRAHLLGDRAAARAVAGDPGPVPDAFVAAAWLALDERERAEAMLEAVRRAGLEDAAAALFSGLARAEEGGLAGAFCHFERAVRLGTREIVPADLYVAAATERAAAHLAAGEAALAEEIAVAAADLFPEAPALHHAAALAALALGDEAAALARARRAAATDPADGAAARLARLLLVRADRPDEAYETWLRGVPAASLFSRENEMLARLEALRDATRAAADRPRDAAARRALARAYAACGWIEEAIVEAGRLATVDGLLARGGAAGPEPAAGAARAAAEPEVERRVQLGRAVRETLGRPFDSVEDAALALCRAARAAGLPAERAALEPRGGEAGTVATPDEPLVLALLEAGLALDLRPARGGGGTVARIAAAPLLRRAPVAGAGAGGRPGRARIEVWLEPLETGLRRAAAPLAPLGRASPLGTGFFVDLDAIRPPAADVREFADGLRTDPVYGPGAAPSTKPALRAALIRRAAPLLGDPGDDRRRIFAALLEARARYVADHELGHLVDLERLYPVAAHPVNNLARWLSGGIFPDEVAGRYEEIAELHAIARAPVPYVPLLSIERALEREDAPGPARRAAAAVFGLLRDEAGRLAGDRDGMTLERAVAVLDPVTIRKAARRRLAEEGIAKVEGAPP